MPKISFTLVHDVSALAFLSERAQLAAPPIAVRPSHDPAPDSMAVLGVGIGLVSCSVRQLERLSGIPGRLTLSADVRASISHAIEQLIDALDRADSDHDLEDGGDDEPDDHGVADADGVPEQFAGTPLVWGGAL